MLNIVFKWAVVPTGPDIHITIIIISIPQTKKEMINCEVDYGAQKTGSFPPEYLNYLVKCTTPTLVSSLIVSPFAKNPLSATFNSARLASSRGWIHKTRGLGDLASHTDTWLFVHIITPNACWNNRKTGSLTWAVVTEQVTSPLWALIILPKAVMTSEVRDRRPLSASTSMVEKSQELFDMKQGPRKHSI